MPWPMVHFAIAAQLTACKPSPHFLVGSIAPDALHVREKVTRQDKGFTHLVAEDRFPSIELLQESCLAFLQRNQAWNWQQFVLGYMAHIYADLRWTETIYAEFERDCQGSHQEKRNIYNKEVSQIEFILLHGKEWGREVVHSLQQAEAFPMEPFVTQAEVSRYRDLKIGWLQDDSNEPRIKPIYFTKEAVDAFIVQTSEEMNVLAKAWGIDYLLSPVGQDSPTTS